MTRIVTGIKDGQSFYDEEVRLEPRQSLLGRSVTKALGGTTKDAIPIGYERIKLRWMKPDGKGGLVPR